MLASFLLALREGLEAAIILGIILGVLRRTHQTQLGPAVWRGTAAAIIVSLLIAVGIEWAGAEFEGPGEMIFEGLTFLLAAGLLTWMIFWMQKQNLSIRASLEADVLQNARQSGQSGLFWVAFLSIVREGVELAVYLLAARLTSNPTEVLAGALTGLAAAAGLGWLAFATTRRLNFGLVFRVINLFLFLFAAGLITHSVHEFIEVGWLPALISPVWDLQQILPDQSLIGQVLSTLFGYSSNPALLEVLAYSAYLLLLGAAWWLYSHRNRVFTPSPQTSENPNPESEAR